VQTHALAVVDLDLLLLDTSHELGLLAEEEVQVGGLLAQGVVVALDEVPGNLLLGDVGVLGRVLLRDGRDGLLAGLGNVVGAVEAVGRAGDVLGRHRDLAGQGGRGLSERLLTGRTEMAGGMV
jgi:hypothetical protein